MDEGTPNQFDEHDESHFGANVADHEDVYFSEDPRSGVKVGSDSVDDNIVTWEASEYIHHQKDTSWYLGLAGIVILIGAILYLTLKDIWSIVVLVFMASALVVFARREPRVLRYSLSGKGLSIGDKHFDFEQFKSFSVSVESGIPSITLEPTQRFMPPVSIYFAEADGDQIVGFLSQFLPHEPKKTAAVDRISRKLRF